MDNIFTKLKHLIERDFERTELIGEVDGIFFTEPIYINDPIFGKSTYYPSVLEIKVQKKRGSKLLDEVGKIVRKKYFDFDFIFNVCFSCARPNIFGNDRYGDPYSIWFNVFLGYYQIDIPSSQRSYPFGFNSDRTINPEEILKIGKSDWNYFSNFLYGVPIENIENPQINATAILPKEIKGIKIEEETIHGIEFCKVTVNSFKVISSYQADNDETLNKDFINIIWQTFFGSPIARKEFPISFIPTNMKAVMYIYSKTIKNDSDLPKNETQESTFIFGGTINLDYPENALNNPENTKTKKELEAENNRFLDLQIKEIKKVIPKVLKLK
jgi:hypothetical protein